MTLLRPCSSCQRHVTVDETRCPFCAAALEKPTIRYVGRLPRMTRSALFAVGATMVASCGSEVTVFDDDGGSSSDSSSASSGSTSSGNIGGMGGEMNVDLYGAPGTGGFDPGSGGSREEGDGGEGGAIPLYGAAPDP